MPQVAAGIATSSRPTLHLPPTSGSAALHPRLLIARPLRGRQPRGNITLPALHRPDGPARGKNAPAGLRPERVRRDESRLYASKTPCGRTSFTGEDHTARPAPLSGANHSITAGKRSAPADGRRIYIRAPWGANAREDAPPQESAIHTPRRNASLGPHPNVSPTRRDIPGTSSDTLGKISQHLRHSLTKAH